MRLLAIALLVTGCKKSTPDPEVWSKVRPQFADTLARLDKQLVAAADAVDKYAGGGSCPKDPSLSYAPTKTHNLDTIEYADIKGGKRLGVAGGPLARIRGYDLLLKPSEGGIDNLIYPHAIPFLSAIKTITTVVVVKATGGGSEAIDAEAFVVKLEPAQVLCSFKFRVGGNVTGSEAVTYKETTYNRKTGATIREREFTEGGYQTGDPMYPAREKLHELMRTELGATVEPGGG